MAAIMAAKIRGAKTIIAVDRVQSRLELARELGATHAIDTSKFALLTNDLIAAIREISPGGTNVTLDTTGVKPIIDAGAQALQTKGQLVLIGIVQGTMNIDVGLLMAVSRSKGTHASLHSLTVASLEAQFAAVSRVTHTPTRYCISILQPSILLNFSSSLYRE